MHSSVMVHVAFFSLTFILLPRLQIIEDWLERSVQLLVIVLFV